MRSLIRKFALIKSYAAAFKHNSLKIPYENYHAENLMYIDEISHELSNIFALKNEIEYEIYLKKFENEYAAYCGLPYAVGLSSGTTALAYSLIALGISNGNFEVITTAHTYISTGLAILDAGAKPVFVDIGEDYYIDPEKIVDKISTRSKAIIPVHLYGYPCAMDRIMEIAAKFNLYVIEDCCKAHGAAIGEKKAGTFGDTGCFSFHSSKIIGAPGDGGIVITAKRDIAEKIDKLRLPNHNDEGILKSRRTPASLGAINIPFLIVKLKHAEEIINKRKEIAVAYQKNLSDVSEIVLPKDKPGYRSSYRNFTVLAENREGLRKYLLSRGVETKIFYDIPLHLRKEFAHLGYSEGDFPVCEEFYKKIISLPISQSLRIEEIDFISELIRKYYGKS